MSTTAGFDEKTPIFDGKKFGLSVPTPGVDMASPLREGAMDPLRLCTLSYPLLPSQSATLTAHPEANAPSGSGGFDH